MKQKRTVIIGDPVIISKFRKLCKDNDRTPSKVVVDLMDHYIKTETEAPKQYGRKPKKT